MAPQTHSGRNIPAVGLTYKTNGGGAPELFGPTCPRRLPS